MKRIAVIAMLLLLVAAVVMPLNDVVAAQTIVAAGAMTAVLLTAWYMFDHREKTIRQDSDGGFGRFAIFFLAGAFLTASFYSITLTPSLVVAVMFALAVSLWFAVRTGRVAKTPFIAVMDYFAFRDTVEIDDTDEGEPTHRRRLFNPMGPLPVAVG